MQTRVLPHFKKKYEKSFKLQELYFGAIQKTNYCGKGFESEIPITISSVTIFFSLLFPLVKYMKILKFVFFFVMSNVWPLLFDLVQL